MNNLEEFSVCHTCGVPEHLEHIAMECDACGAKLVWGLTKKLWAMKYPMWPSLSWGLVLAVIHVCIPIYSSGSDYPLTKNLNIESPVLGVRENLP